MPQITLRVSDETFKKIQTAAAINNLTMTDYVLSKAIPTHLEKILTISKVIERISSIEKDKIFSIRDLFSNQEWGDFTHGSRISTGRLFFQSYSKNDFDLKDIIKFVGKNSINHATYKKLI